MKMRKRFKSILWALLSSLIFTVGWGPALRAEILATLNVSKSNDAGISIDGVEMGNQKSVARQVSKRITQTVNGNPLWSVPLSVLTATQERPVFSASRRPPPRVVAGPRIEPVKVPVAEKPAEAEHPSLALIGAVVGDSDAIAIFLDRTNQSIIRLRAGEIHAGWMLDSVLRREVTLKKADRVEILEFKRLETSSGPAGVPGVPVVSGLPVQPTQTVGGAGPAYAPFTPRSTPKNGESDGL
jgi:general secretion pathway protein N